MREQAAAIASAESNARDIVELLILKLSQRGILFGQIPRLIKDVLNILRSPGQWAASSLNERLDYLGWGKQVLDEFTLQLIVFLVENREESRVPVLH
ncbi:MAG: hypothetical protein AB1512_31955 [Thermodesulfobacteriota bacterium]